MTFKLYYGPMSCGGAVYMAASLAGIKFESEQVSLATRTTASGTDYYSINEKGTIPALVFNDGTLLTETVASLAWISTQATKDCDLQASPSIGTMSYFEFIDKLGYVNSEMHKGYGPLFLYGDTMDTETKQKAIARLVDKFHYFTSKILGENNTYVMGGDKPSAIDIYAYYVLSWADYAGIDLKAKNPIASEFVERMKTNPKIAMLHAEMKNAAAATKA